MDQINLKTITHRKSINQHGEFTNESFSEGSARYAFMGEVKSEEGAPETVSVLKMFKTIKDNTFKNWNCDINACQCAIIYAAKFFEINNQFKEYKGNSTIKEIEFVLPKVAIVEDYHHDKPFCLPCISKEDYKFVVIIEQYLSGSYIKFSDNYGYENVVVKSADVLLAFSHWTYESSGHKFMVTDLQGIEMDTKFVLTDPAVHSVHQQYGVTDLGYIGMKEVLKGHTCNTICTFLRLPKFANESKSTRNTRVKKELTRSDTRRNAIHKTEVPNTYVANRTSLCSCFCKGSSAVYPPTYTSLSFVSKKSRLLRQKVKNNTSPLSESDIKLEVIQENE